MTVWIRSILFNFLFYPYTGLTCVVLTPFFLGPRPLLLKLVTEYLNGVFWLERTVLGLKLELRGLEYLPESGSYLIASKHQSAYETMKLHYLFGDPAIIYKKELSRIPLWGRFMENLDGIAIDRRSGEGALASIVEGANRMKAAGRPIIIYPQGTRVRVGVTSKEKPYKSGIWKMYNAAALPIVPVALNSGVFWPRNSFLKKQGTVIIQFLEPIQPGKTQPEVMADLESRIESTSNALVEEAYRSNPGLRT